MKIWKIIFIVIIVVILGLAVIDLINKNKPANTTPNNSVKYSNYTLPIQERKFYIGMVANPKTDPTTTFNDIVASYQELGKIGEVTTIWNNPNGIGLYDKLKENKVITGVRVYGLKPIITLNLQTVKEVNGSLKVVIDAPDNVPADINNQEFRDLWVAEAKKIAGEFKPEYFSLGNEINDYFYLYPQDLDSYLSLYQEAYRDIKSVSPKTKIFVVFSYNHLIDNNQWDLLSKFNDKVDIIGLTSYPNEHFFSPDQVPENYYSRLSNYTNKKIAFTEIGWPSTGTNGEKNQAEFLVKFLDLTKGIGLEMIDWLFLHETKIGGIAGMITRPETGTIALKKSNDDKKEIYNVWLDLYNLKK
jgi:hypothetical protein